MKRIEKLIVHPGRFHADDVLCHAICQALLVTWGEMKLERRAVLADEDVPQGEKGYVLVADVGMRHHANGRVMYLDHHQNANLPCAAVLLYRWAEEHGMLPSTCQEVEWKERWEPLLQGISDADTGVEFPNLKSSPLSILVSDFVPDVADRYDSAFLEASKFVQGVIKRLMDKVDAAVRAKAEVFKHPAVTRLPNGIVLCEEPVPKVKAAVTADPTLKLIVTPSERADGTWVLLTVQDEKDVDRVRKRIDRVRMAKPTGVEIYRHHAEFISVHASKEDALKLAHKSIEEASR